MCGDSTRWIALATGRRVSRILSDARRFETSYQSILATPGHYASMHPTARQVAWHKDLRTGFISLVIRFADESKLEIPLLVTNLKAFTTDLKVTDG